ncbi:MAG: hypothetical protein DRQ55_19690 [Planctomycetota bacterium]|nr:MAG: hypothetical protein DRQ55_19690 [Planctomycetota bacterium]
MGLDEALLRSVGDPPTLRLYSWAPDALSLGYFQPFEDVGAAAGHPNVVRRLTGGGAIHHHSRELTFSITIDADDEAYRGPVARSYETMHCAIIAALGELGVEGACMRRDQVVDSDVPGTGMCFHESTPLDVCWAGPGDGSSLAKGVGTAQRRSVGRVLHHGSIKLGPSPLEERVATLHDAGLDTSVREAADALTRAVATTFEVDLIPADPTADLLARATTLGERYGAPDFVHRVVRRER